MWRYGFTPEKISWWKRKNYMPKAIRKMMISFLKRKIRGLKSFYIPILVYKNLLVYEMVEFYKEAKRGVYIVKHSRFSRIFQICDIFYTFQKRLKTIPKTIKN